MISQREKGELARFYTVTDPKKHQKGYTVYKVTARIISRRNPEDVQEITVWKRYSDFRKLHQDLRLIHRNLFQQPELFPPFAKAKVFGRFDDSVIEERRQCAEDLLQFSANIPALYSSQYIEDFFKGGEVHDGSELIGPAEPFSDFLADGLSDCSSEVQKDIGGVEDLTAASQSEYGGLSSDSDLISLLLDTDSLADVDDGMASDWDSPNKPLRGASPSSLPTQREDGSPAEDVEPGPASRVALFPRGLRPRGGKRDYVERASEQIRLAVQREAEHDYQAAFSFYRNGVDLLLQGVQGEHSPTRREAVKRKTAEYLMRAEQISSQYLRGVSEPASAPGALGSRASWSQGTPVEELKVFRVLGVIDKVLLVVDKRTQETFILKGLRKSSESGRNKKTIVPRCVPNMVRLHKYIISEDTIFLVLQHAEGGKLWSHISKFLNKSPEDSLDIPFIQKSHTAAVHLLEHRGLEDLSSSSVESEPHRGASSLQVLPLKSSLTPSSQDDSSTQDEEGADSSHGALLDSGGTSEEECTNSYLTLCNEYEQEKIEPASLEERPAPAEGVSSSSRSHPLLSSDSLCSPSMAQELRFFTEDDQGEVFSPACLPTEPLHQTKQTPMEFFRIDSKDSASELLSTESGDRLRFEPCKPFLPSAELEDVTELAGGFGVPRVDPWGVESDRASNESVPVISFKEAVVGDAGSCEEGRPPDLLVNLPSVADVLLEDLASAGPTCTFEPRTSPKFGKPDVLQVPYDLGDDVLLTLSVEGDPVGVSATPKRSDDGNMEWASQPPSALLHSSSAGEASEAQEPVFQELPAVTVDLHGTLKARAASGSSGKLSANSNPSSDQEASDQVVAKAAEESSGEAGKADSDVSQVFKDLDEVLLVVASMHLPEEYVQRWAVEIVIALDALHQEGIICRDLNPNNILLNDKGHIQLTYFCCWSEVEHVYDKDAMSAMFCAPEVGSISEETAACDWWSLGAILFELLTGKSLQQCHPAGIGRHTMLNVPDFVSEEAKSLLQQLLQYNPVERLGAGVAGVDEIKSHPFFTTVTWPK